MKKKPNDASSENGKEKFEVADVFRLYGQGYRLNNPLPSDHTKVMRHIQICRTAALGGHKVNSGLFQFYIPGLRH